MATPSIQTFMRGPGTTGKKLEDLAYIGIFTKQHPKFDHLFQFKYDPSHEIDWSGILARECRGLILDEKSNWNIVSHPFHKFFSYGDFHAHKINWPKANVYERVDGVLTVLYPYADRWHVSTINTPDASDKPREYGSSYKELFWRTFESMKLQVPGSDKFCFFFELSGKYLPQVVQQTGATALTLLGARQLSTGLETGPYIASQLFTLDNENIPIAKRFKFSSAEEAIKSFQSVEPTELAGYVVSDDVGRMKIEHPGYVALHRIRPLSNKGLLEIVRRGKQNEVMTVFPELGSILHDIRHRLNTLVRDTEKQWEVYRYVNDKKAFAEEVCKSACPSALYAMRANKTPSIRSFIREVSSETLVFNLKLDQALDKPSKRT